MIDTGIIDVSAITANGKSMSSREIAELTGKQHKHVLRDINVLIEQGAITEPNFGRSAYTDASGKSNPEYLLDFDATMTLVTGYNAPLRAAVIRRWRELETCEARPAAADPERWYTSREIADAWGMHIRTANRRLARLRREGRLLECRNFANPKMGYRFRFPGGLPESCPEPEPARAEPTLSVEQAAREFKALAQMARTAGLKGWDAVWCANGAMLRLHGMSPLALLGIDAPDEGGADDEA